MIEQLIRKYINKHINLSESMILSEAERGWQLDVISADSLKGQRVDKQAIKAGFFTGLPIIARKTKKGKYSENQLEARVKANFETVARRDFPNKYNPKTTLYIYKLVLDKPKKKIWNIWGLNKNETGINQLSDELLKLLQKSTYYTQTKLQIDNAQGVALMSYNQADKWFKFLEQSKTKLNITTPLTLPEFESIKTNVVQDDDQQDLVWQDVKIKQSEDTGEYNVYNNSGKLLYQNANTDGFIDGDAKMSVSTDGESLIFQPLNGMQGIEEENTGRTGVFVGEFKNGAPYKGTVEYDSYEDDDPQKFTGELDSKIYTTNGKQYFSFTYIKGRLVYGNDMIFDGTFKGKRKPWDGDVFNNKNQAVGHFKNGEYARGLEYPYTWKTSEGDVIVYKQGTNVYLKVGGDWGSYDVNYFETTISGGDGDIEAGKQAKLITDPAEIEKLNKQFLNIEPSPAPTLTPTPTPTPKKKKYIVLKNNTINVYAYDGSEFVINVPNSPTSVDDRTKGYPLSTTKSAKIKNGDGRTYKMYKVIIIDNKSKLRNTYYFPESGVKIVER